MSKIEGKSFKKSEKFGQRERGQETGKRKQRKKKNYTIGNEQ